MMIYRSNSWWFILKIWFSKFQPKYFSKTEHRISMANSDSEAANRKINLVLFSIIIAIILFFTVRDIINLPAEKVKLAILKQEFKQIKSAPGSEIISQHYNAYPGKTGVTITYSTSMSDKDIQDFYNNELLNKGWYLTDEEKVYDWWRDLGGKIFTYNKLNFTLSIEYSGDRKGYGWVYDILLRMKQ